MSFFRSANLGLALCTIVAACGGDEPTSVPRVVSEIRVAPATVSLLQRESIQLFPSAIDGDGTLITGVAISFESSNTAIVIVSSVGLVASVGPAGSATVTLRGGGASKQVPVTVTTVPTGLTVTPNPGVLSQKGTLQLSAQVFDLVGNPIPNSPLNFASSNTQVATVSPTGLVTSLGPSGTVTISVAGGNLTRDVPVAITQVATTLRIAPNPIVLTRSASVQLVPSVLDAVGVVIPGSSFTFSSSDQSIVTVSLDGVATTVGKLGSALITARSGSLLRNVPVMVVSATHPVGDIVRTIPAAGSPYGSAVSSNGVVYVSTLSGTILRADLPSFSLNQVLSGGSEIGAVAFNSSVSRAYAVGIPGNGMSVIDVATNTVVAQVGPVSGRLFEVLVSRDDRTIYMSTGLGYVYLVNANTNTITSEIFVGGGVVHLAQHPSQPLLYASSADISQILQINTQTGELVRLVATGSPQDLVVSADGSELFIANEVGRLDILNLLNGVRTSIPLSCGAFGMVMTPDFQQLYIGCTRGGIIHVVDLPSRSVVKSIVVGGAPRRLSISSDGTTVVVPDELGRVIFIQ